MLTIHYLTHSLANPPKPMNWADDVDEEVSPDAPKIEERDEGNGIKVITEYRTNPEGKKVKVSECDVKVDGMLCLNGVNPHQLSRFRLFDEFDAH
jgi:hypothetical protein